jgi:hypothetical protein
MQRTQQATVRIFLVGTERNKEIVKVIGWPVTSTMDEVEAKAEKPCRLVDGIIATCVVT